MPGQWGWLKLGCWLQSLRSQSISASVGQNKSISQNYRTRQIFWKDLSAKYKYWQWRFGTWPPQNTCWTGLLAVLAEKAITRLDRWGLCHSSPVGMPKNHMFVAFNTAVLDVSIWRCGLRRMMWAEGALSIHHASTKQGD